MATCLRNCEECEFGGTCPTSCREDRITARERTKTKRVYKDYTTMTDGITTFVRYGHIRTATLKFWLRRKHEKDDDRINTGGEIWDDILDTQSGN